MEDIQKAIQEAIEKSINNIYNPNKPLYEFVATCDVETLVKCINK